MIRTPADVFQRCLPRKNKRRKKRKKPPKLPRPDAATVRRIPYLYKKSEYTLDKPSDCPNKWDHLTYE